MANESSDKEYEHSSTSELPENKLRHNFLLGDMAWVKHNGALWWPAQVIDETCVSSKPKKKGKYDCLVRLYGTCQYMYVDPWKSNTEFKMMLKQEGKSATKVFHEVLEKELSCVSLPGDKEESDNSEGTQTKVTTQKTSSRKVRKQEGLKHCSYKGVKKAATAENLEDESEDQDQEVGSTAATGATVQKGKRRREIKSSSSHGAVQTIDKVQVAHVLDKESCKIRASVVRREGLRRSSRSSAKEYLDAGATEDSMVAETSAPHTEIKAMVRDILFKEIIDKERDAEMVYVDQVINGICSTAVDSMTGGTIACTKGEGIKQNGTGVQDESNQGKSDQATEDTMQVTSPETRNHTTNDNANPMKEVIDTTPSRDAAIKEQEEPAHAESDKSGSCKA